MTLRYENQAMRTLRIEVDHLPSQDLSPNARVHWTKRHTATRIGREEVGWLAAVEWQGKDTIMQARISYEFTTRVDRNRDQDNLIAACKPWQDGLIDAGVIFYDDAKHLRLGSVSISKGDHDKTVIIVEELKEG